MSGCFLPNRDEFVLHGIRKGHRLRDCIITERSPSHLSIQIRVPIVFACTWGNLPGNTKMIAGTTCFPAAEIGENVESVLRQNCEAWDDIEKMVMEAL